MRNTLSTVYDIWTDGSYRQARQTGGAGWVIQHNGRMVEGAQGLPSLKPHERNHGSDIAEMLAVACALRQIPAQSFIQIRIDCANVREWIKVGAIAKPSKACLPTLRTQFMAVTEKLAQMAEVNLINVSGQNPYHSRAHELSRQACHIGKNSGF